MRKIRIQNVQKAQGMVEFALVLPVLLLVILGVFAFGHMFFAYSSVVSASREAARWGSAVGAADSGAGAMPRYQDCAAIKAAAVRVGTFAGVSANTVSVQYDNGPTSAIYANCPVTAGGTSGPDVSLGDRIVVTVTIQYKPIVPFLQLPTFPLTATSARTIIKSLPVGDAPTAVPLWPTTTTTITPNVTPDATDGKIHLVIGQTLTLNVAVIDSSSLSPMGGEVTVNDNNSVSCMPTPLSPDKNGKTCTLRYTTIGERTVTARYDPLLAHYMPSAATAVIVVDKASTSVVVETPGAWTTSPAGTATLVAGTAMPIRFHVIPNPPSEVSSPAIPLDARARININGSTYCEINNFTGDSNGCDIKPSAGDYEVIIYYDGNGQFYGSSSAPLKLHVDTPTPTPLPSIVASTTVPTVVGTTPPVVTPGAPTITPQATALPKQCPYNPTGLDFTSYPSSILFNIVNPPSKDGGVVRTIDSIKIAWPQDYGVKLMNVAYGDPIGSCNLGGNCLLSGLNMDPPAPPNFVTIDSTNSGIVSSPINNLPVNTQNQNQTYTKQMRLIFNGTLPEVGTYAIRIHFAGGDNCQIEIKVKR